jgi:hypothetical protein
MHPLSSLLKNSFHFPEDTFHLVPELPIPKQLLTRPGSFLNIFIASLRAA